MFDLNVPGRLIAIVGIDGAGKTTQVEELTSWLRSLDVPARQLPHQTLLPVRQSLDEIAREDGFEDHLEMLGPDMIRLISACCKFVALSALKETAADPESVTLMDRYTYCQYAAVRLQRADNEEFLRRLNRALPAPDLTIFLDVDPAAAQRRIESRGIDRESIDFLAGYRRAYRSLPEFDSFVVVDGNGRREAVQRALREVVASALNIRPPLPQAPPVTNPTDSH
ncbi:dTMP kinase [Salinispora oceanensis]|uniref:dTMP kinase n=1 Tax=Salinispora oceanensis TaxID=1050199 RepID=UPI00037751BA|nr:dTMP kinase [Salinispora oceanensis]